MGGAAVVAVLMLVVGAVVGSNWNYLVNQFGTYLWQQKPAATLDYSSVDSLYRELQQNYDGTIDSDQALDGLKHGLVSSLGDKYTVFMNATEAAEFERSLSGDVGAGVGIELGERDGYIRVLRTLQDNPARRGGVLAGDIIYKVNDEDVSALSADEVATKIRGDVGSEVKLTLVRGREELDFTLTREKINNLSAYVEYQGDTAVLTITRFDSDTGKIVSGIADEIVSKGINRIVVDLRSNGGGYVNSAVDVTSLWVDGDLVMDQRSLSGLNGEKYYAQRGKAVLKGKSTIVLTNGSTASAAEIMAGALRDYGAATLLGEKTYGKGVVQVVRELSGGNKLKVTIARWYTPHGANINQEGIAPDVEVVRSFDDINANRDPQLDAALQKLRQ
jgi:carboxyl-terminal processing protease